MKTVKFTGMWRSLNVLSRNWNVPSTKLPVVVILMFALFVSSCRSKQVATQTSVRSDSLTSVKTTVIRQGTALPPRKTKLDVPLKAVAELPERAVYMANDGIVTVTLERRDSTLVIKAETDSIMPKLEVKTMESYAWEKFESKQEEKPPDKMPWWQQWRHIIIALTSTAIFIIILPIFKNLLKKWLKRMDM